MTQPIAVTLTIAEVAMAASVGVRRHLEALERGNADSAGLSSTGGWTEHIEGAAGELALAKLLGRFWDGSTSTYKTGGDLGDRCQVRTRSRHDYELIIRPGDNSEQFYVLVTGVSPMFRVWGYMRGKDAQRDEWWQGHGNRPAAWFVPQAALTPLRRRVSQSTLATA